jgi:hypothetical protein
MKKNNQTFRLGEISTAIPLPSVDNVCIRYTWHIFGVIGIDVVYGRHQPRCSPYTKGFA